MSAKILIIDDEKGIRDLFTYLLQPHGYNVSLACNGLEGLEKYKQDKFDVILLDVHMPKMRGPEVLKIIKEINPKQKVIIFTSGSDPDFIFENKSQELGVHKCLNKPFCIDEVLSTIKDVLHSNDTSPVVN
ncbi:MAG: hypothetical protein A2252_02060 [Elusimicrobia bacterium RIFOXYA2_FULL_39_19]|nr:MAG: hypothetical protein A2252_02060 [Elusimicrobia bacterium RIFOXYA2_FULL_39_19]